MAHRPVGAGSSFTFTSASASSSSAFSIQSNVLRVVAVGGAAHVAIGTNPTATTTDYYIPSGETATLGLTKASNRVVGVTTGTTTIVTVPEGTQVPFSAGDYVSLSVTGQSYYNFTHQEVLSVNTTADYDGYFSTRMTVNYNSSGIVTAFSATDATVINSHKISAIGSGGSSGTIHFQQVQISGDA